MKQTTNNNNETSLEDVLEKLYYFLKDKLNFDDFQASTFVMSIILLPLTYYLGFTGAANRLFREAFYIIIVIDIVIIFYSFVKFKYFRNLRINYSRILQKEIVISNTEDINKLNPLEFEIFVKELYKKLGYNSWITQRTHDHGADVIAEKNSKRIAIQVKYSKKNINGYGIYQTERGKHNYKADKGICVTNSRFTNQAKLDALRYDIQLMDTDEISRFLRKYNSIRIKIE
jgi:restriction system protein